MDLDQAMLSEVHFLHVWLWLLSCTHSQEGFPSMSRNWRQDFQACHLPNSRDGSVCLLQNVQQSFSDVLWLIQCLNHL